MKESATSTHLPIEMWEKVFQHLRVKDAWNLRLVCKAWRTELDNHFDKWTVCLDENSPYFQHPLQLKVKEATVLKLSTPVDMGQDGSTRLFKHPELLERLSIPEDSYICPENLLLLLNSCEKTIKHLDLQVGVFEDVPADPFYNLHPNGFDFSNLESLDLNLEYSPPRLIQRLTIFKLIVELSTMRKIKSLTLDVHDHCINCQSSTILDFIGKNGSNLEELDCYLDPTDEEPAAPADNSINLAPLRKVAGLKKILIHYNYGIGFQEFFQVPWEFVEAWSTLLKGQRNLTHLSLMALPISRRILRRIFHNNENTLRNIELRFITDFDIDLAVLVDCMHLKELRVCIFPTREDGPALRNVRSLPAGVRIFKSKDYLIESEDILDFFVGHEELVEIRLDHSGSYGSNGVTPAVFNHITINRNMTNKLRKVCIGGFSCSTAWDLTAWKEIVRDFVWDDEEDFQNFGIKAYRTQGKGGGWSGWRISTYSSDPNSKQ